MPTTKQWWCGAVMACAGDVATTWYGMEHLGTPEMNPVVASLLHTIGVLPGLVTTKLIVLGFAVAMWHTIDDHREKLPVVVAVIYGIIVALNLIQIVLIA